MGLYCVDDISGNGILFVIKLLHFAFLNRSDADSNKVYVYDGQGTNTHLHVFEKLHTRPVVIIKVYEQFLLTSVQTICERHHFHISSDKCIASGAGLIPQSLQHQTQETLASQG